MLKPIIIPEATPAKKVEGMHISEANGRLISWDYVSEQMLNAQYYWISTVYPDGRPHPIPVWGIWYENRFHFEGRLQTAWGQNILNNPHIAVNLPDAEQVVIIEGTAYVIEDDDINDETWDILDQTFQSKYQVEEGSPYICVNPNRVLAWDGSIRTMTRWVFER